MGLDTERNGMSTESVSQSLKACVYIVYGSPANEKHIVLYVNSIVFKCDYSFFSLSLSMTIASSITHELATE